jgi:(heptosyl)LPS beta-1,4-glucosyltransferase
MTKPILSVAIIARDEEEYIGGCLESIAGVADETIILLDTRTRDRTATIAQAYHATTYHEPWRGYAGQRNRALDLCQGAWVLFVDADERLTPPLRHELAALKRTWDTNPETPIAGYGIPRYNLFFSTIVQGGGWYPDYQLRLLHRTRARFDTTQAVHEVAQLDGRMDTLSGHFLHINIERLDEFWHKQSRYALEEARTLHHQQRPARWRNFAGAPAREFWRRYIRLRGWRDGPVGFFLCLSLAWFEIVKYACLRLIQGEKNHHGNQL